jgi:3-phenylpropionate/cinnamic acid dioxygenase small subunit
MSSDLELFHEVSQFIYRECELLDERRFQEWLELLTDDFHYWMPVRESLGTARKISEELSQPGEVAYFDDTRQIMEKRIKRLEIGPAWAEHPPSRTRHMISNIRIANLEGDNIEVHSNFLTYRSRLEHDQDFFIGGRHDVLRRTEGKLMIAKRTVILDQSILQAKNISIIL